MTWPRYSLRTMMLLMAAAVPLFWFASSFTRVESFYVDQITGSYKRTTSYWGWTVREKIEPTALVEFFEKLGRSQPPRWVFASSQSWNCFASGLAPPILYLHKLWPDVIEAIPQEELLAYIWILQNGTYEEHDRIVNTIDRRLGKYYTQKTKAGG